MDVSFVGGSKTTITVDSGAEESVCPWNWGHELFGTREANQWMRLGMPMGGRLIIMDLGMLKLFQLFEGR